MELPLPEEGSVLVIRTDFSDDAAWKAFQAAVTAEEICEVFLADAEAFSGGELAVLAVDLCEPGIAFRVTPREFAEVAANLIIGNMDLAEYADGVDAAGFFRGFD